MKTIGSYILSDQPIGKGGMATVYEARHKTSGERFAIKFLNAAYSSDVNIRSRFIEEGRRMAAMNHEHIVRVVGVVEEQGTLAIVMQLIDGMSLKEYIETHGRLPDHGIARIIQDISSALSYVHSKGIIHRDVSTSNIMIDRSGDAYLMDFGISKYLTDGRMDSTQTGLMMGSPIYMSPEQVRDSSRVGIQSDIYSFGVVIWQMVTCKVPYGCEGMSVYDILNKVVNEPLSKTGTKWDRIIQRATRKNPAERYGNLNELADDMNIPTVEEPQTLFPWINYKTINNLALAFFYSVIILFLMVMLAILIVKIAEKVNGPKTVTSRPNGHTSKVVAPAPPSSTSTVIVPTPRPVVQPPINPPRGVSTVKVDANGDGVSELMWLEEPAFDIAEGCDGDCNTIIKFSNTSIPSLVIRDCIGGKLENLGDLNNDGADEIGLLPGGFTGCTRQYRTWTLKQSNWIHAIEPFLTHCEYYNTGKPHVTRGSHKGYANIHVSEIGGAGVRVRAKMVKVR